MVDALLFLCLNQSFPRYKRNSWYYRHIKIFQGEIFMKKYTSYEDFRKQIEGDSKYDNITITYPWNKEVKNG